MKRESRSQPHFWAITQQLIDAPADAASITQDWSEVVRERYPMRNSNDVRGERARIRPVLAAVNFLTRMQFASDVLSRAKRAEPIVPADLPPDHQYYVDQVTPDYRNGVYDLFMRTFVYGVKQASSKTINKLASNERWRPLWETYRNRYTEHFEFWQILPNPPYEIPSNPRDFLCEVNSKENTHSIMQSLVGLRGAGIRTRNASQIADHINDRGDIDPEMGDALTRHAHANVKELTYPASINGITLRDNGLTALDPHTGEVRSREGMIGVLRNWHNAADLHPVEAEEVEGRSYQLCWNFGRLKKGPWRRPQECHAIVPIAIDRASLSGFLTLEESHSVLYEYREYFPELVGVTRNRPAPANLDGPKTVKILEDLCLPYANELARHTVFTTNTFPTPRPA